MPYIDANGSRLYYEDTGGSGPAVIFSHGLLMDGDMFAPQVEALRTTYWCITWDQRGFGRTGPASEPFTYWTSARDVLDIMSSLNIEAASLAGLSQGGFLSMRAALLAPERVCRRSFCSRRVRASMRPKPLKISRVCARSGPTMVQRTFKTGLLTSCLGRASKLARGLQNGL